MLTAHQISKSYTVTPLFQNVTFSVNAGERVGLIGPNGCGKTTLLRILAREEQADRGYVSMPPGLRLGYLPQGFEPDPALTVSKVLGQAGGSSVALEAEVSRLALFLAEAPEQVALQVAYDRALRRLERFDPGRAMVILSALGLDQIPQAQVVRTLSGGQKTRLALALVLLGEPEVLLLDEPTNHLDIGLLEWLEQWLADFPGGVLLVSHDRTFLNRTVNKIVALDPHTNTAQEYAGNYSDYLEQYLLSREKQWEAYRDQLYEVRRMQQDVARIKEQARSKERATKNDQQRRYAKKVARVAKAREKKLERYLEAGERVQKPARSWQMKLEFAEPVHLGQDVLVLDELAVGYPDQAPLLSGLNLHIKAGERIVLTGANGSGKTTLLRTVAGQIPSRAGRVRLGSGVHLGYMSQEQRLLDPERTALAHIRESDRFNETEARSFLHFFLFSEDEALRPSRNLSFGERARLALAMLVAQGCNFLLLDEPLNHLDIPSRSRFEEALVQFDGTTLAVVHDRTFIDNFATEVWVVEEQGIRREIRKIEE